MPEPFEVRGPDLDDNGLQPLQHVGAGGLAGDLGRHSVCIDDDDGPPQRVHAVVEHQAPELCRLERLLLRYRVLQRRVPTSQTMKTDGCTLQGAGSASQLFPMEALQALILSGLQGA